MTNQPERATQRFYKVQDIQTMFGIGRNKALALMKTDGFPVLKIGRTYYVDSEKLEEWIVENRGKEIPLKGEFE